MAARPNPSQAPTRLSAAGDRHFDGLVDKFSRGLYGGARGELRLALLDMLLPEMLDLQGQPLLDVGAGLGQMSAWFASRGHQQVTLSEPSADMLEAARLALQAVGSEARVTFLQAPLQHLSERAPGPWPLIVCHAVLEWLAEPRQAMATLSQLLAPGGQLSLMVFNRDALRFSNIVKGNLDKALTDRLAGTGQRQRLTPISPLSHAEIEAWARERGLVIEAVAGIRVFHDYLRERDPQGQTLDKLLVLEKRHCRDEPYWRLGRYLLYTLRKPLDGQGSPSEQETQ